MGSKLIDQRLKHVGARSELDTWIGYSHVPFVGGLNIEALLSPNPLAIVFNPPVLDSTKRHITHFCYSLIDCETRVTGIKEHLVSSNLSIFPNPSTGIFTIQMPKATNAQQWRVEVFNIEGKSYIDQEYPGNIEQIQIDEKLPSGMYFVKIQFNKNNESSVYTGKINIVN